MSQRKQYTREFKYEAIALVKDQGYTFANANASESWPEVTRL